MDSDQLHSLLNTILASRDENERKSASNKVSGILRDGFKPVFQKLCNSYKRRPSLEDKQRVLNETVAKTLKDIRRGRFNLDFSAKDKFVANLMSWMRKKANYLFMQVWGDTKKQNEKRKSLRMQNFSEIAGHPQGEDDGRVEQIEESFGDEIALSPFEQLRLSELMTELDNIETLLSDRDQEMIKLLRSTAGDPTEEQIENFEQKHHCDFANAKWKAKQRLKVLYNQRNNDNLSSDLKT